MGGGRDLGFVRVDVQEAGGGTRGFPKAYNRIEYMQQKDGTCRKVAEYKFLEKAGTQYLGTYIDRRHATVAEWVALRPILEVCDIETGYKGGVRRREPWWRQTAATKYLSATLKDILEAARERRWKSGRRGWRGGDRDAEDLEDGAGRDGSQDSGTDTGDAQVGE